MKSELKDNDKEDVVSGGGKALSRNARVQGRGGERVEIHPGALGKCKNVREMIATLGGAGRGGGGVGKYDQKTFYKILKIPIFKKTLTQL